MKVCDGIKRRIDEADQPDQLNIEISRHTSHCAECQTYAEGRAALRGLLAASARVSVPMNFDAVLNARLAEVKAQKSFSWFSPTLYLQFGTATAVLAVMFFAAQYSNLLSNSYQAIQAVGVSQNKSRIYDSMLAKAPPPRFIDEGVADADPRQYQTVRYNASRINRLAPRTAVNYVSIDGGGVILVRGQNGEREVTVPTVSIGAQPLLYSSRQTQPVRSVSTSF